MERTKEKLLERWVGAGLIDATTAERIRAWEGQHAQAQEGRLGRFAFAFGGLLLGAGVLLFIAANWDQLSPWGRFATVAVAVMVLHLGGGLVQSRSAALATTLHAVGTAAFGGGVFLAGQAFNLAENWPRGFLLWSLGAACGLWVRRDWPQAAWVAILVPLWLAAEWSVLLRGAGPADAVTLVGATVLAVAYVSAVGRDHDSTWRRALALVGAIVLLPVAAALPFEGWIGSEHVAMPAASRTLGWGAAIALPLAAGAWLRGRAAWPLLVTLAFALVVSHLDHATTLQRVLLHVVYAAAAAGLVGWGVADGHRLRVNLGVVAFALTVLSFYYSSVFDRFGRALGMIGLGVLFIAGGWWLERVRRRMLGHMAGRGA